MNNKVEAKALVMLCSSMYEANPKPGHLELSHVVSAALPFTPSPFDRVSYSSFTLFEAQECSSK